MQNRREPQRRSSPVTSTSPTLPRTTGKSRVKPSVNRLTFIDSHQAVHKLSAENAAKHRHAIFTEAERRHMSEEIINSVYGYGRDPDQAILDLERFESSTEAIPSFSLFRGPFGVSKLTQSSEPENTSLTDEEEEAILPIDDWIIGPDYSTPETLETSYSGLFHGFHDVLDNDPISWDLILSEIKENEEFFQSLQPPLECLPISFNGNTEAWPLLSHYRDRVISLISPFEHGQEVPWKNQIVPCAVSTLGETIMSGTASHARLALLNALLSASSFHLGQHSATCIDHWTETGNYYLKLAQHHLIQCVEEANMSPPIRSKYKEALMALLSLSTAYMIKGDSEKRSSCLIQAERFISVNGFTQTTVSSKRRALHHCYAYMRIMAETTSIDSLCANMANTNISDKGSCQAAFRIYPGVTFSGDTMATEKDPNIAQRDLHLAIPGRWSLTLFPKMYGVTENFLMLLSQVIRLANERDISMTGDRIEALDLKEFWIRAKVLEKGIHLLVSPFRTDDILVDSFGGENQFDSARAQAMYTALLIYFYRRIYDLDVALLQKEVGAVKDSLIRAQEAADRHYGSTATLIWPAFIAACEAVGPELELFFSSWFNSCYTTTGLRDVSLAKQVFEMIWTRRRDTGLDGYSWPEILRSKKIRLMFI